MTKKKGKQTTDRQADSRQLDFRIRVTLKITPTPSSCIQ